MKIKVSVGFVGGIFATTLSLLAFSEVALSLPKGGGTGGLNGSYIGISDRPENLTSDLLNSDLSLFSGSNLLLNRFVDSFKPGHAGTTVFQGRYDLPNSPFSVRGSMFLSPESRAIEPTVSFDLPIARNTNFFVGGGVTLVQSNGKGTPLGDVNSPVVTAGIESEILPNMVVYGNAKFRMNQAQITERSPVNFQVGAGFRF